MKVSYVEGLASYGGPESCVHIREGVGEALTGPRAVRDPAHARKHLVREPGDPASFCAALGSAWRRAHREAQGRTTMSHRRGKSDCCITSTRSNAYGRPTCAAAARRITCLGVECIE